MTCRFVLLALLPVVAHGAIAAQAEPQAAGVTVRPMSHEDLWLMRRLGSPVLSRDGRRVVVSVTEPSYDADETQSDLWLLSTAGGAPAPRRLTSTAAAETGAAIRPDGSAVVFSAKRGDDEKPQLYLLPLDGPGEARRLTTLSTGAAAPIWSPDGRWLAFESTVFPAAADDAENKAEAERRAKRDVHATAYDHFPVRAWDRWLDDTQKRPFVLELDDGANAGEPRDLLHGTALVRGPGYDGSSLAPEWAPDGSGVVFAATANRHQAAHAHTPSHLYFASREGDAPRRLTPDGASWSAPQFAPDGALVAMRTEQTEFVYNLPRLARCAWPADPDGWQVLAGEFDRPIHDFAAGTGDGGTAYFWIATEHGRRRLFTWRAGDGPPRLLDPSSRGVHSGLSVSADRTVLVTRYEGSAAPAEIVQVDGDDGSKAPLTTFNRDRAAELDWQPFREFWFDSSAGRKIHCWMALPPAFDEAERYPLVMMMHGGPHSSSLDQGHIRWSMQLLAAPGYVVVAPDYTGSVGYGEAFSRAIQGDPLRTPCAEINEAATVAITRFAFVDETRQAALGASYGGHMANWLEATTERYRCLVSHAGLASLEGQWATSDVIYHRERNLGGPPWAGDPIWREQSPATYAGNFRTPMLLTIGERDYRVPLNQTLGMWSMLQRQQVESRLLVFHRANHWIMNGAEARYFWQELHGWLARWFGES